jgi:hypothetical protein
MDTTNGNNKTSLVIKRQVQLDAISKAVYLVTDLFSEGEPLKMSLRRMAIDIIENEDKINSLLKLNSLIKLSRDMDLITTMNAGLLIRVIDSQLSDLNSRDEKKEIYIDKVLGIDNRVEIITEEVMVIEDKVELVVEKKTPTITINNNTQNIKTINNISMDIGSRRKRILEIVKSRGAVTINEFIESIKGCSSKTIQRELTSLVLSGTLKKTGERRWSKYSLK